MQIVDAVEVLTAIGLNKARVRNQMGLSAPTMNKMVEEDEKLDFHNGGLIVMRLMLQVRGLIDTTNNLGHAELEWLAAVLKGEDEPQPPPGVPHPAPASFDVVIDMTRAAGFTMLQIAKGMGITAAYLSLMYRGHRPVNRKAWLRLRQFLNRTAYPKMVADQTAKGRYYAALKEEIYNRTQENCRLD